MKRILSLALSVFMMMGNIAVNVHAEDNSKEHAQTMEQAEGKTFAEEETVIGSSEDVESLPAHDPKSDNGFGNDFWASIRTSLTDYPNRKYVGVSWDGKVILDSAKDDNVDAHLWHFVRRDDGSYKLYTSKRSHSGAVMDASWYNGTEDFDVVVDMADPASASQGWDIIQNGDGYALMPRSTDTKVLDVVDSDTSDGSRLRIHEMNQGNSQKFYIDTVLVSNEQTIPDGVYHILSAANTGYGLSIFSSGMEDGSNVHLWTLQEGDPFMMWEFTYRYDGYYRIVNLGSGKGLDVYGSEVYSNVHQWLYDENSTRQKWHVIPYAGNYRIVPESVSHGALEIADGVVQNENNIRVYDQHDGLSEQFVLSPCSYDIAGCEAWLAKTDFEFEGYPVYPGMIVRDNYGHYLEKDVSYSLSYENNAGIGTATVTATGIWPYTGSITKTFNINGLDLGEDFWAVVKVMGISMYANENPDDIVAHNPLPTEMRKALWHFKQNPDGSYYILVGNGLDNIGIDNWQYKDEDEAYVKINTRFDNDPAQLWGIFKYENGYGLMPRTSRTRVLTLIDPNVADRSRLGIHAINFSDTQVFQIEKINDTNAQTGYSLSVDKTAALQGSIVTVTIADTLYVTSYKLHIIEPDGEETIVDNNCNNVFSFVVDKTGTYTVYAEVSSPVSTYKGSMTRDSANIVVSLEPMIVRQPQSQIVNKGDKAVASVDAIGDGLTYQWYLKNKSSSRFSKSSVTTNTYSVKMSDAVDGRQIYCVITDRYGDIMTTRTVTLMQKTLELTGFVEMDGELYWYENGERRGVYGDPRNIVYIGREKEIGQEIYDPESDGWYWLQAEYDGAAARNKEIWLPYVNPDEVPGSSNGKWVRYDGFGKRIAGWYTNNSGTYYYDLTTGAMFTGEHEIDGVTYYFDETTGALVIRASLEITGQPQDQYATNGQEAIVSVEAQGDGLTYQWYLKNKTATKFSKSSVTKNTYSVMMSDAVDGRQVYCVVTDQYGNSATSETATLRRMAALAITSQPQDCTVANGEKASTTVVAQGQGLSYQWYVKNKTATRFSKSSVTKNTYSVTMSDKVDGRQLYCIVTDDKGNTVQTRTATMVKDPNAIDYTLPQVEPITQKVLVVNYDPVFEKVDGKHWHELQSGWNDPHGLVEEFQSDMNESSHGYITYQITEWIDVEAMPEGIDGFTYDLDEYYETLQRAINETNGAYWTYSGWEDHGFNYDYEGLLDKYDICRRVNDGEIDEVWVFTGPLHGNTLYETRMVGRNAYWCNSPGLERDCRRFVVYGFNYERGVAEMIHDAGHRMESILHEIFGWADYSKDYEDYTDWEKFSAYDLVSPGHAGVGLVHFGPNSAFDYDWGNQNTVMSYCDDWLNYPNLTGVQRAVNCTEWDGDQRKFIKWWFYHIPVKAGTNPENGKYYNWWLYFTLED